MPKTVVVYGFFRTLHTGHRRFLSFARSLGDKLVVGLLLESNSTKDEIEKRESSIKSLEFVDKVVVIKNSIEEFLEESQPDVLVKGYEQKNSSIKEEHLLATWGGKVIFASGLGTETPYPESFFEISQSRARNFSHIHQFCERHNITLDSLNVTLSKMKHLNVGVFGDTILDEYVTCTLIGLSAEDNLPVMSVVGSETFIGGAAIVASHCHYISPNCKFYSILGSDETADLLIEKLSAVGLNQTILRDDSRHSTRKIRYKTEGKTIFRISELSIHAISNYQEEMLINQVRKDKKKLEVLLFSDFNYGLVTPTLYAEICADLAGSSFSGIICVDSQYSSQIGNLGKFTKMDLVTPTENEARQFCSDATSGLVNLATKTLQKLYAKNIILKLGKDGILIQTFQGDLAITDQIPALNTSPVDVSGAGDSMFVGASLALASGTSIFEAALIGSFMSAIQIANVGNKPISYFKLQETINEFFGP